MFNGCNESNIIVRKKSANMKVGGVVQTNIVAVNNIIDLGKR
jgi:hypothetical protein